VAERNEEVTRRIVEMLDKYPTLKSRQLHDMAQRMDTSIAALSLRSFHARYVLPILRERARAEGRIRPRKPRRKKQAASEQVEVQQAAAESAPPAKRTRRSRTAASADASSAEHARVRGILLQYVREIAGAESGSDLVALGAGIDDVVRQILSPGTD
jgi:hypothetical protein